MRNQKKIKHAAILINYHDAQTTANCVNSINKSKDAPHIIVVDNGSSNECIAELKTLCPNLDLIQTGSNLGYSAGNNIGIKKALRLGAQVVYIINNDTLVDQNLFFLELTALLPTSRVLQALRFIMQKVMNITRSLRGRGISFGMLVDILIMQQRLLATMGSMRAIRHSMTKSDLLSL